MKTKQTKHRQSRRIKTMHKKSGKRMPLKAWLRSLDGDPLLLASVDAWFFNKRASTRNPPQGIGRTRKRVKRGSGGAKQAA